MGYCAASDVAIEVQHLLNGEPMFSTSTSPTNRAVNSWISSGCSVIETLLEANGYVVPVASTVTAYNMLRDCNALYAAARAEWSRTNVILGSDERTRGDRFDQQFKDCRDLLLSMDLTKAGIAKNTGAGYIYTGGIAASQKQNQEAKSGRVLPRFQRGQFDFPGSRNPTTSTASNP